MTLDPVWVAAMAAMAAVIVAIVGFLWNYLSIREMKTSREGQAHPILEYGLFYGAQCFFVFRNIGNGIATKMNFEVTFEGPNQMKSIKTTDANVMNGDRLSYPLDNPTQYWREHGDKFNVTIKGTYENIYEKRFKVNVKQRLLDHVYTS